VFPKIKKNGYYAIETGLHFYSDEKRNELKALLQKEDLQLVSQIHTDSYEPGQRSKDIKFHLDTYRKQLEMAKNFGVYFCNSHTGYDGWNAKQREEFFGQAIQMEKQFGLTVAHETHRRRVMYNPWDTKDILTKFPELKVTADLSHWFVVLSNDLDGEMDIIKLIGERCILIHARVGYDNGPQVNDPRAPENQTWVDAHERCWDVILKEAKARGDEYAHIEPEFGPPSYMPTQPYTQMPVVNLWDICEWQTQRQVARFHKQFGVK
jgi:hypothetical protein